MEETREAQAEGVKSAETKVSKGALGQLLERLNKSTNGDGNGRAGRLTQIRVPLVRPYIGAGYLVDEYWQEKEVEESVPEVTEADRRIARQENWQLIQEEHELGLSDDASQEVEASTTDTPKDFDDEMEYIYHTHLGGPAGREKMEQKLRRSNQFIQRQGPEKRKKMTKRRSKHTGMAYKGFWIDPWDKQTNRRVRDRTNREVIGFNIDDALREGRSEESQWQKEQWQLETENRQLKPDYLEYVRDGSVLIKLPRYSHGSDKMEGSLLPWEAEYADYGFGRGRKYGGPAGGVTRAKTGRGRG